MRSRRGCLRTFLNILTFNIRPHVAQTFRTTSNTFRSIQKCIFRKRLPPLLPLNPWPSKLKTVRCATIGNICVRSGWNHFIGSGATAFTRWWRCYENALFENVFYDLKLWINDLQNLISSWPDCRTYLCKVSLHWFKIKNYTAFTRFFWLLLTESTGAQLYTKSGGDRGRGHMAGAWSSNL